MPQIPMYQERATPTTSTPVGAVSAEPSKAVGGAIQGLGRVADALGAEYAKKKTQLRTEADISDYEVMRRQFSADLEQKKNDAMINDGVGYSDVYEKVVLPEINKFQEKVANRGYSKGSMGDIMERFKIDSAEIYQKEVHNREKMELLDYTNRIERDADSMISSGDFEGADAKYETLAGIVGQEKVDDMKSTGRYYYYTGEMQAIEELRIDGSIDDDEYFKSMSGVRNSAKESGMNIEHQKQVDTTVNSKIYNFKKLRVKEFNSELKNFQKKVAEGKVESVDYYNLRKAGGDALGDAAENAAKSSLNELALTDDDAKDAIELLNSIPTGELPYSQAVRKLGKKGGGVGELAIVIAGEMVVDLANSGNPALAYEVGYRNKTAQINSYGADFVGRITSYANMLDSGQGTFVNNKMKALVDWTNSNPKPTQEDYDEFVDTHFKQVSYDVIEKMNAPQVQQKPNDNVAPQGAIDYLKSNPELKEQFKAKYGYIPEGI
jgi:hypothetical protein